jgi:hypothetical protein
MRNGQRAGILMAAALLLGMWQVGYGDLHLEALWPLWIIGWSAWRALDAHLQASGLYQALRAVPIGLMVAGVVVWLTELVRRRRQTWESLGRGESVIIRRDQ